MDADTAARFADLDRQLRGALDSITDLAKDIDRLTRQLEAADLRIQALEAKPQK